MFFSFCDSRESKLCPYLLDPRDPPVISASQVAGTTSTECLSSHFRHLCRLVNREHSLTWWDRCSALFLSACDWTVGARLFCGLRFPGQGHEGTAALLCNFPLVSGVKELAAPFPWYSCLKDSFFPLVWSELVEGRRQSGAGNLGGHRKSLWLGPLQ